MKKDKVKKQHGLFKKKRGGVVLSRDEVKEIKKGRKKLRKDMRKQKIRGRKEFELTASSLGLYFDKNKGWPLLLWFLHGRWLWALLGALLAFLFVLFMLSVISQMKGHFTVNMGQDMFRQGFSLSETKDFENPTSQLYSEPAVNVPCVSISSLPEDVDMDLFEGAHNGEDYFAYSFWIRNEGEEAADYSYELRINSESRDVSSACWVMVFLDGKMTFFAEKREDGSPEAIPSLGDDSRGFWEAPMYRFARFPDQQYEVVKRTETHDYYRIIPIPFETQSIVTSGLREQMEPMETHKYTIVFWLEGDDPDCTDELIGGHLGMELQFELENKNEDDSHDSEEGKWTSWEDMWLSLPEIWANLWKSLKFWDN